MPPKRGATRGRKRASESTVQPAECDISLTEASPDVAPEPPPDPVNTSSSSSSSSSSWWSLSDTVRSWLAAPPPSKRRRIVKQTPVVDRINQLRQSLLDLSLHSGFLNAPVDGSEGATGRGVHVPCLTPGDVYQHLVQDGKAFTFAPAKAELPPGSPQSTASLYNVLQTDYSTEELHRRLSALSSEARAFERQRGFNVLYFAIGLLQWADSQSPSQQRYAPLLLIPAALSRTVKGQYQLSLLDTADPSDNFSLIWKMKAEYQITLPVFEGTKEYQAEPRRYFAAVAQAIVGQAGWRVKSAGLLGLFSFAKSSLYCDLSPESWPATTAIEEHPLVAALLDLPGAPLSVSRSHCKPTVHECLFPLPADNSQATAIQLSSSGHPGLLIYGPPGTGKSQTICNIIANAIHANKTILFVSSKQAALDVVRRQLVQLGLGPCCAVLHSRDATFKGISRELRECLEQPRTPPLPGPDCSSTAQQLLSLQHQLHQHSQALHSPIGHTRITAFQALQHLTDLRQKISDTGAVIPVTSDLLQTDISQWGPEELERREVLIQEVGRRVASGPPICEHPWRGVHVQLNAGNEQSLLHQLESICSKLTRLDHRLATRITVAAWDTDDALFIRGVLHAYSSGWTGWLVTSLSGAYKSAMDRFRQLLACAIPAIPAEQLQLLDDIIVARRTCGAVSGELADLLKSLNIQPVEVFVCSNSDLSQVAHLPLLQVIARLRYWVANAKHFPQWMGLWPLVRECASLGLDRLIQPVLDKQMDYPTAVTIFHIAFYDAVVKEFHRIHQGSSLCSHREVAGKLHRLAAMLRAQAAEAVQMQYLRQRSHLLSLCPASVKILLSEVHRSKGHRPLRVLLQDNSAGPAMQAMKPIFMMSPMSVATLLEPGKISFDLLIIDEASQMQPVEAIGAVARARQLVVVGDEQQLPPTRFFDRMVDVEDDVHEEADVVAPVGDMSSILSLAAGRGFQRCMLKWHYRSHHESLITISNRELYDNQLQVVPRIQSAGQHVGLFFRYIPEGRYDRGNKRNNVVEARYVAEAIMQHAHAWPQLSLGVCTFSATQQKAIMDQLDDLRRQRDPVLDQFLTPKDESSDFFVKNLENVQGDERDVIFISVGYGTAVSDNALPRAFGPLGMAGGERRLNVLISRAKYRMIVFSSLCSGDIEVPASGSQGLTLLRKFLSFAESRETGSIHMSQSPVAEALRSQLCAADLDVDGPLGTPECRLDLAIRHPYDKDIYILGIVFDQDSTRTDCTDLLVLEECKWHLEVVCLLDWYRNPQQVVRHLIEVVNQKAAAYQPPADPPLAPQKMPAPAKRALRSESKARLGSPLAAPVKRETAGKEHLRPANNRPVESYNVQGSSVDFPVTIDSP